MKTSKVLKRIFNYTQFSRRYMLGSLIFAVIGIALSLFAPVLIGEAVDCIVETGNVDFQSMLPILMLLAATILLSAFFQWLMSLCTNILTQRTTKRLRTAAFEKLNHVPLSYIDAHPHGDTISRMVNDIELISQGLLQGMTQLISGLVTIFATLLFMVTINLHTAMVVILITPISLVVAAFITKLSHGQFKEQAALRGQISGYAEEMVGNQKTVKAFCYEEQAQKEFEEINRRLYKCGVKAQFYGSLTNPSTRFVNGLVYAATGIVGALQAINGTLTVGQISSFLAYANQYTKPFNEVTGVLTELQTAFASARRVLALLDEEPEPSDSDCPDLTDCDGSVLLRNAAFSYQPESPVIRNFNLSVSPGERIALVGPTGCGKTTLINLLMRFYDLDSGEIQISGTDIRSVTRSSLRRSFGMVLQDTWLFSGTIRDNIAYGKPDATDEEIIEAAKTAYAHSFIKRLPEGYNTLLSEDEDSLSQGQKQLLSIARIMLTKPPMLILDEATSSIDTRTELKIQAAFDLMMEGRTSFIVAHRLSTIQSADVILVMKDGQIIEQGDHNFLIKKGGFYARLYNSQFAGQKI